MALIKSRENIVQNNSPRSLVIIKVDQVLSRKHVYHTNPIKFGLFSNLNVFGMPHIIELLLGFT